MTWLPTARSLSAVHVQLVQVWARSLTVLSWLALANLAGATSAFAAHAQEYRSSVVGTDFDFIREEDPNTFLCLEAKGRGYREMPDKTGGGALVQEAFIFMAYFDDGTSVDIGVDVDFETEAAAEAEARRYVPRLGKLPTALRRGVERLVVHKGEEDATAFSDRGLIVVYSDNAKKRISTHDLEETIFHESVHAAWDNEHRASPEWRAAQESDGGFVTDYARRKPGREDLAESALFAYTLIHHPERIPEPDASRIRAAIPARIAFVKALVPPGEPVHFSVGPAYACDGSGETFTVSSDRFQGQAQRDEDEERDESACDVDLAKPGQLSDILSNALMRDLGHESGHVRSFLDGAHGKIRTSEALMDATAKEFGIERATLESEVVEWLHVNCTHPEIVEASVQLPFAAAIPPVAAVETGPAEPEAPSDELGGELRTITWLLALMLLVNLGTLLVLLRKR